MKPRILLVEDDAVTRAFMVASLEALPAAVDTAASVAEAGACAAAHAHDLWLFDANLPDGDGAGLLADLRARGLSTPALAHTAAPERQGLDALRAAGFVDALVKPLSAAALQSAVRLALARPARSDEDRHLRSESGGAPTAEWPSSPGRALPESSRARPARQEPGLPQAAANATERIQSAHAIASDALCIWDDTAALLALKGQSAHVAALRKLFLDDLRTAHGTIVDAARSGDTVGLRATLHKLYAGCGFVGAARLEHAARALGDWPDAPEALEAFDAAAQATLSSP